MGDAWSSSRIPSPATRADSANAPDLETRPTSRKARANVVQALRSVERGERNALDGLHDAVCAFVATLRDEGLSKDDALLAVREVMMAPATPGGERTLLPAARDALIELSSHWCTEEYEREPKRMSSTRSGGEAE